MTEEELIKIREYIIENIIREPSIYIKCNDIDLPGNLDVIDIIVGLYDMLNKEVTGEPYDYMWHWANKIGFWCDDARFYNHVVKGDSDNENVLNI